MEMCFSLSLLLMGPFYTPYSYRLLLSSLTPANFGSVAGIGWGGFPRRIQGAAMCSGCPPLPPHSTCGAGGGRSRSASAPHLSRVERDVIDDASVLTRVCTSASIIWGSLPVSLHAYMASTDKAGCCLPPSGQQCDAGGYPEPGMLATHFYPLGSYILAFILHRWFTYYRYPVIGALSCPFTFISFGFRFFCFYCLSSFSFHHTWINLCPHSQLFG